MSSWSPLWLFLAAALSLSSCAIAPAKVKRVATASMRSLRAQAAPSLHDLVTTVISTPPDSPEGTRALGDLVERWKREKRPLKDTLLGSPQGLNYQITFAEPEPGMNPLDYFDDIQPAFDFKISRIRHHQRPGIGAPLMALRENRHRDALERYYPPEAITRPVTAVAQAGPVRQGVQQVRIQILCSLKNDTVIDNGKRRPLAADFSVAWASALSRSGKLNQSAILDMLTRTPKRQPQLYLMEPYDPQKEPLIMIHGLLSTPLAWAEITNDLWADAAIRKRYQIWHYLYNTSAPALYSARILRTQLRELRSLLDPDGNDPAMRRTTLLTHSMGGLIGKALAVKPGDVFWEAAFKVPHESLDLTPQDHAMLTDAFEWEPDQSIRRIIFVATPHRGSDFADNPVGRIGSWLTKPPSLFQAFYERLSAANPGVFTPAYEALGSGKLNSVSALSPRQPTLRIMSALPLAPQVKTHSIIGNRGRKGPLEKSSDGIVPYTSSHLEKAESELVVPAGHGAFHHPAAMKEIMRILQLP